MTVPLISLYSGEVPNPNTQGPEVFSTNAVDWTNYQALNLGSDINATVIQFNIDIETVNNNAISAAVSAASAESSAQSAASSANMMGNWSDQTGSASKPYSVTHAGSVWVLLNNLADVTTSEPGQTQDWFNTDLSRQMTQNRFLHFYRNR